jgi:iron complex transport system substrate-binding protein
MELLGSPPCVARAQAPEEPRRVVRHAKGETRLVGRPRRVVALTNEATEAVLALGLKPVGAVRSWTTTGNWYPHLGGQLQGVAVVGEEYRPDVPAIAGLRPDLILGNALRQGAQYEKIAEIAPTVFSETLRGEWQRNLRLYAEALARGAEAEALLADWDRRVEDARRRLPGASRTRTAAIRFLPDRTRLYHENSFSGTLFAAVGFAPPDYPRVNDFFEDLPLEGLAKLGADLLFYFTYPDSEGRAEAREREWTNDVSWRALGPVRAGRAFRVDDGTWNTAGGILAARVALDDLVRLVTPSP